MRKFTYLILLFIFFSCNKKVTDREFFIEEFNWKITVPEGFEYLSKSQIESIRNRGAKAIERELGEEIVDESESIFFIRNGNLNNIEAVYQPYDEEVDGNYEETNKELNAVMYDTFKSETRGAAELDSISSSEIIDGLKFNTFYIKLSFEGKVLHTYMFSHLFDNKDLGINLTFSDEKMGEQMLTAVRESKFITD